MVSNGNLQYIADTLLLEKILRIEEGMTKQAGLVDTFRSVAEGIKKQVADRVERDGVGTTLVNYLAPAVLGRIWAPFGILASVASFYGVNIGQIINSMMSSLKGKIEAGQTLTMNEINEAGKQASGVSEDPFSYSVVANDFFHDIRIVESEGKLIRLVKEAQSWGTTNNATPMFGGKGSILAKIFGNLGRLKGKWFLIGIVVWFVKTVLLGAGLVEGTEAIAKGVGLKEKTDNIDSTNSEENNTQIINDTKGKDTETANYIKPVAINLPTAISHNFKPSGQGQQYHINDGQSIWVVPLINGNVEDTLLSWTTYIYPEVAGFENELKNTQPFNKMVSVLSNGINPQSPNYLTVPKGLNTRKAIVDKYVGALSGKINKDLA